MNKIFLCGRNVGLLAVVVGLAACASAPRIVGPIHPAIPSDSVVIYNGPSHIPQHYTVVAKLDAAGYGGWSSPSMDALVLRRLRREAARLGANGLLLIPVGHFPQLPAEPGGPSRGGGGPLMPCCARPLARAEAIYYRKH